MSKKEKIVMYNCYGKAIKIFETEKMKDILLRFYSLDSNFDISEKEKQELMDSVRKNINDLALED